MQWHRKVRDLVLAPGTAGMYESAVFFGLVTGFVESGIILFRAFVLHRIVSTPPFHVWAAPLIYAVLFCIPALGLMVLRMLGVRSAAARAPYLYAFLGAWILTLPFAQLGRIAPVVLALGVAAETGRRITARQVGFGRFARRAAIALSAAVGLLALALPVSAHALERWRMHRLGDAPAGSPNIVFIILDTVRAASLHLYGSPLPTTPHLEQWAARGVVFDGAMAPASWTLPSHASMFTGLWVHELDVNFRKPLGPEPLTITEVLRDHGYATGAFVGNDFYTFHDSGLGRGFAHYDDYQFTWKEIRRSPVLMQTRFFRNFGKDLYLHDMLSRFQQLDFTIPRSRWGQRKNAQTVSDNFIKWASEVKERPFYAFLNYFDAHEPHRCPPPFRSQFKCQASQANAYHGAVAYLDDELGRLFDEMQRRGLLRNTIVIVASDHGEQLGDHGLWDHGNSLYMQLLHVPLVIWGPGIPAGRVIAQHVSLRDLGATILDQASADDGARVPGRSLAAYWSGEGASIPDTATLYSEIVSSIYLKKNQHGTDGDARLSLIRGERHYILDKAGREELYDLAGDMAEARDIKSSDRERATLDWARHELGLVARRQGALRSDMPSGSRRVAGK